VWCWNADRGVVPRLECCTEDWEPQDRRRSVLARGHPTAHTLKQGTGHLLLAPLCMPAVDTFCRMRAIWVITFAQTLSTTLRGISTQNRPMYAPLRLQLLAFPPSEAGSQVFSQVQRSD
jgi:hypothetical protein